MKIIIEPQNKVEELLVKILCREENEEVHRLYHHIAGYAQPFWVFKDGIQNKLYETDLYYADTVEGKTFLYTENEMYETTETLSGIEQRLKGKQFVRISKNCLINIDFLIRVEPYSNHRLLAYMKNGEKLIVGRTYIPELKNIVKRGR
ncbi:MAG: LytTR family transcriptional regulator DNA-binding domain-containing protein [Lachnospiraceae bacterium]|nr:LytTR family transcriptional regulator DNA-binding domain-containing protein [Lachnospiraceae bacterium]